MLFYGSEDADKLLRPYRKHYAADGGVEIVKDLVVGTTEFTHFPGYYPKKWYSRMKGKC